MEEDGVFAAGDNSQGQFFDAALPSCANFVKCENLPCSSERISHLAAWGSTTVVVENSSKVFMKCGTEDVKSMSIGLIKSISCAEGRFVALLADGRLVDESGIVTDGGEKGPFSAVAVSNKYTVTMSRDGFVRVSAGERSWDLENQAIAIGCTDEHVYVSWKDGVVEIGEGSSRDYRFDEKIVGIWGSEVAVAFLSETGKVYVKDSGPIEQVFGIPPVAWISVGVQHFAAITKDGALYTWGFNPSGQLGNGSDFPRRQPGLIMKGVSLVACGTNHTIAVKNKRAKPLAPKGLIGAPSQALTIPKHVHNTKDRIQL